MRRAKPLVLLPLLLLATLILSPLPGPIHPTITDAAPFALPPGFVDEVVIDGLRAPTAMDWDAEGRLYIAHKAGLVSVAIDGVVQPTPFIDLSAAVNSHWDRGLIGLAVHPEFPAQPYLYLLYTHDPADLPGAAGTAGGPDGEGARVSQLLRVRADSSQDYRVALPAGQPDARTVLLGTNSTLANIGNPWAYNDGANASCLDEASGTFVRDCLPADGRSHSIGSVRFAPDGSLFVSNGDASDWTFNDIRTLTVQDPDAMNGKLFRIDPLSGAGYADNPFFNGDPQSNRSKLYAYGFRNPFRFAFHPQSGEPYVGDVGDGSWEEVNAGRGANFGWPCYEGGWQSGGYTSLRRTAFQSQPVCTALYAKEGQSDGATAPVMSYPRPNSGRPSPPSLDHEGNPVPSNSSLSVSGQAVSVGDFYIGSTYPITYQNGLFLSDFNNEWLKVLHADGETIHHFGTDSFSLYNGVVQMLAGPDTNLYYLFFTSNHNSNNAPGTGSQIRRIRYVGGGNRPPVARIAADITSGPYPLAVTFTSQASYDPDAQPLSFSWNFGDGESGSGPSVSHTYLEPGTYTTTLTVQDDAGGSDSASLLITAGNSAPVAQIFTPVEGDRYSVGSLLEFSGAAEDLEEGALAGPQLHWEVLLNHNDHAHGDFFSATGLSGSFVAPDHGDGTAITLCLTATDSQNLSSAPVCRTLPPRTSTYTFTSEPSGLSLTYGQIDRTTPFTVETIIGSNLLLAAPLVQAQRSFAGWDHGGASEQFVTVGAGPRAFHAAYVNRPPVALPVVAPDGLRWPVTAAFSGTLSYDPEGSGLTYAWEFGDGATAVGLAPSHRYEQPGSYITTLTVTDALGASASASITIAVANNLPVATLNEPSSGQYAVGDTITFSGAGSDIEDGALGGAGLVWQVIRYTASASETLQTTLGATGSFTVPDGTDDTAIEVRLTARDSNGGIDVRSVRLTPRRATLTLESDPPGVELSVNGVSRPTPFSLTATVGAEVEVAAPSGYAERSFAGWSTGAARAHRFVIPERDITVTARFETQALESYRVSLPLVR